MQVLEPSHVGWQQVDCYHRHIRIVLSERTAKVQRFGLPAILTDINANPDGTKPGKDGQKCHIFSLATWLTVNSRLIVHHAVGSCTSNCYSAQTSDDHGENQPRQKSSWIKARGCINSLYLSAARHAYRTVGPWWGLLRLVGQ